MGHDHHHHQLAMQQAETELLLLRKGPWLEEEDERLISVVSALGERRWDALAKSSGLRRSGKSCRLRWMNYLRPNLKHGHITQEEAHLILELHKQWGNRWSRIARRLPGRTDNVIKNYWRSHLRKQQASVSDQGYLIKNSSTSSMNNDGQQNSSSMSMQESVSPCSSSNEDNLSDVYDDHADDLLSRNFQISCSSPYETRLTDWICNWTKEEQSEESDNLSYCSQEWITAVYSDSIWDDGSLPIWDMD